MNLKSSVSAIPPELKPLRASVRLLACLFAIVCSSMIVCSSLANATEQRGPLENTNEPTLRLRGEIRGHSEQPKVIFIIPWQNLEAKPLLHVESPSLIPPELLEPLDRLEFLRQTRQRTDILNHTSDP